MKHMKFSIAIIAILLIIAGCAAPDSDVPEKDDVTTPENGAMSSPEKVLSTLGSLYDYASNQVLSSRGIEKAAVKSMGHAQYNPIAQDTYLIKILANDISPLLKGKPFGETVNIKGQYEISDKTLDYALEHNPGATKEGLKAFLNCYQFEDVKITKLSESSAEILYNAHMEGVFEGGMPAKGNMTVRLIASLNDFDIFNTTSFSIQDTDQFHTEISSSSTWLSDHYMNINKTMVGETPAYYQQSWEYKDHGQQWLKRFDGDGKEQNIYVHKDFLDVGGSLTAGGNTRSKDYFKTNGDLIAIRMDPDKGFGILDTYCSSTKPSEVLTTTYWQPGQGPHTTLNGYWSEKPEDYGFEFSARIKVVDKFLDTMETLAGAADHWKVLSADEEAEYKTKIGEFLDSLSK